MQTEKEGVRRIDRKVGGACRLRQEPRKGRRSSGSATGMVCWDTGTINTHFASYYWTPLAWTLTFRHWPLNSTLPPGIIRVTFVPLPQYSKFLRVAILRSEGYSPAIGTGPIFKEELTLNRHPPKVSIECYSLLGRGHGRRCRVPSSLETAVPEQSEEPSGEYESLNWWERLPRNRYQEELELKSRTLLDITGLGPNHRRTRKNWRDERLDFQKVVLELGRHKHRWNSKIVDQMAMKLKTTECNK